ncbi:MAG: hypothetical protein LBN95_10285 [Prevotellaceae bacterium]|jgi:hypothetical protein|nr:hypothetical protein [Prevotellaceae bacterium]
MKKLFLAIIIFGLFGCSFGFFHQQRTPKIEIPVVYNIGWWSERQNLSIDSLSVQIIESNLNLFNSQSLVSYSVSGTIEYNKHWQPFIEKVHISERINTDTTQHCDRIIEITPVIKVKENKKLINNGTQHFSFLNEHTITSNHWGNNRIKFVCGNKEQIIELMQRK